MRIYNRKDFMKLPAGTLYSKVVQWHFGPMEIKGETLSSPDMGDIDWACADVMDVGEECYTKYELMLNDAASFPLDPSFGRDGCFADEDNFMVFEKADLEVLRKLVAGAIKVAT